MKKIFLAGVLVVLFFLEKDLYLLPSIITIPKLMVNGTSYSVTRGSVSPVDFHYLTVVHLAYFYQWTKEDPLFVTGLLDTKTLKKQIQSLDATDKQSMQQNHLSYPLMPISFLLSLVEVSEKTKTFLVSPSDTSAQNLVNSYTQSQGHYSEHIAQLAKIIQHAPKDKYVTHPYIFINSAVTPETVAKDLQLLDENGKTLQQHIQQRTGCLSHFSACKIPFQSFSLSALKNNKTIHPSPLPVKLLYGLDIDQSTARGPYGVRSACWGWGKNYTKPLTFLYLTELPSGFRDQHFQVQSPKKMDEIYYRRLNPRYPPDKVWTDQGQEWQYQLETATYMCSDLSYQPMLSTIDLFFQQKKHLFSDLPLQTLPTQIRQEVERGKEAEEIFFQYPNEDNFVLLLSHYGYTYRLLTTALGEQTINYAWEKNLIGKRDLFLTAYLEGNQKLSHFDLILNHINQDIYSLSKKSRDGKFQYDMYYVYALRSAYSLTSLSFSPLVWKTPTPPPFLDKTKVINMLGINRQVLTYHQAIEKYSQDVIATWYEERQLGRTGALINIIE